MKLFYSPGACSLWPHIVMHEAGIKAAYQEVDTYTKEMKGGGDLRSVSPKGTVPTLQLDDGEILTEGPALTQYIADQRPESKLAPAPGTLERYRLQEWLNFIGTEVHRNLSVLFSKTASDDVRQYHRAAVEPKFDLLNRALERKSYLMGEQFTIADAYLYNMLVWTTPTKVDLSKWPTLQQYRVRVYSRPAVQVALRAEGLLK